MGKKQVLSLFLALSIAFSSPVAGFVQASEAPSKETSVSQDKETDKESDGENKTENSEDGKTENPEESSTEPQEENKEPSKDESQSSQQPNTQEESKPAEPNTNPENGQANPNPEPVPEALPVPLPEGEEIVLELDDLDLPPIEEREALFIDSLFYEGEPAKRVKRAAPANLNESEQIIYEAIKEMAERVAQEGGSTTTAKIDLQNAPADRDNIGTYTLNAYEAAFRQAPQNFYWVTRALRFANVSQTGNNIVSMNVRISVDLKYRANTNEDFYVDGTKMEGAKKAVENAKGYAEEIKNNGDSVDKKLNAIRDRISGLTSYNHDAAASGDVNKDNNPWEIIWVFDNDPETKVVCEGYAKSFQYLFEKVFEGNDSMVCYCVTGTSTGPHMWNIVRRDGKGYIVDMTAVDAGDEKGPYNHYFMKSADNKIWSASEDKKTYTLLDDSYGSDGSWLSKGATLTYDDDTVNIYGMDILDLTNLTELPPYDGTEAAAPTLKSGQNGTVILNDVTVDGETVEYGHSKDEKGSDIKWQKETEFKNLLPGDHYFFARVAENNKHKAGKASAPFKHTIKELRELNITIKDNIVYSDKELSVSDTDKNADVLYTFKGEGKADVKWFADEELKNPLNAAPKDAGTYYVKISVAENEKFEAAEKSQKVVINKAPITKASLEITAPVKGQAASSKIANEIKFVTAGNITWEPALTADNKFEANTAYTAKLKLTPDNNHRFENGCEFTVNGAEKVSPTVKDEFAELSALFPATENKAIIRLEITNTEKSLAVPKAEPNEEAWAELALKGKAIYDDNTETDKLDTFNWKFEGEAPSNVKIENGSLKVSSKADKAKIKILLSVGSLSSAAFEIEITKEEPKPSKIIVEPADYTMIIPKNDTPNEKTFTAKPYDQYGMEMKDAVTWEITPAAEKGVKHENGKITVSKEAEAKNYTLKASCKDVSKEAKISVVAKNPVAVALNPINVTYGTAYDVKATVPNGFDAKNITYSYADKNNSPINEKPVNAGSYKATATYEDEKNFGSVTVEINIAPKALTDKMISNPANVAYTGTAHEPKLTCKDGNLLKESDYEISYLNNKNAGEAVVNIKGVNNYTGEISKKFKISKANAKIVKPEKISKEFDGKLEIDGIIFTVEGVNGEKGVYTVNGMLGSPDVGTNKKVEFGIRKFASENGFILTNYNSISLPSVTADVTAKTVNVSVKAEPSYEYGKKLELKLTSDDVIAPDTADSIAEIVYKAEADKEFSSKLPVNAGKYEAKARLKSNVKNYKLNEEQNTAAEFEITSASLNAKDFKKLVKFSDTSLQTVTNDDFGIALKGRFENPQYDRGNNILDGEIKAEGNKLTFKLKENLSYSDSSVDCTASFIPEDKNYKPVDVKLTVSLSEKDVISNVKISVSDFVYGDKPSDVKVTGKLPTGGKWTYTYSGTKQDGSNYDESSTMPAEPGKYTVQGTYETDSAAGSASTEFEILKRALKAEGLKVEDHVYDKKTEAKLSGSAKLTNTVNKDDVKLSEPLSAEFENADIGNGKKVTVNAALEGADSWKYTLDTITLTGNITKPNGPVVIEGTATIGTDEVSKEDEEKLKKEANNQLPTNNLVIKSVKGIGNDGADIFIPYPNGFGKNDIPVVIYMTEDGEIHTAPVIKNNSGIETELPENAKAVAYGFKKNSAVTPGGGRGGSSGSSGSSGSHIKDENDFWATVKKAVKNASRDDIIKVNAKGYDRMTWDVMHELKKNPTVSMIIDWDGGKTITIPAGKALDVEANRVYYPLSYLEKVYAGSEITPEGKPAVPMYNPATGGGPIYIEAAGLSKTAPSAVTPASEGLAADISISDSASANESAASSGFGAGLTAAALIIIAALGLGLGFFYKKKSRQI